MGMQCPPRPGPGVNFMKPNGLVAAASITSHTSTPSRSHMMAISLTRPMLIMRKVFSSSLAISATSAVDTGTTVLSAWPYQATARFEAGRGDAAHHLGGVDGGPIFAARVDPLGREGQEEVLPHFQPAGFFQARQHQLARGAGVGARFEHDHHAGVHVLGQRFGGADDERQVGVAGLAQGGRHADGDRIDLVQGGKIGGGLQAALRRPGVGRSASDTSST